MTRASTFTLLSLDRYAKIMGIPPVHFSGASITTTLGFFPYRGSCDDRWLQHSWQGSDVVSREDLASAIKDAEDEIAAEIGYYPAPVWIENEPHEYTRYHRRDEGGVGIDTFARYKSVQLEYGRFIQAGTRAVTLIGTATTLGGTLVYSDADGDGFSETATITLPTTATDECELKAYYPGHAGEQIWEIRPCRTKMISAGNVLMTFWTWQMVDPDLYEQFPTESQYGAPDLTVTANLLASVDVYREYTDSTQHSSVFYWEPDPQSINQLSSCCPVCGGGGCPLCTHTTQDGCLFVRDIYNGIAVPRPADYDAVDAAWEISSWTKCREPDMVKVFYYSGDLSQEYLRGVTCEPLSDFWAWTIAMLATARLERPFCSCGNLTALQNTWREDLTVQPAGGGRFVTQDVMACPFGTRNGEVMAWRRIKYHVKKRAKVAVI